MKKLFAMSVIALAIAGCSDDTTSEKVGNSFGDVSVSGTALVGETLTATVTDANGVEEANITYTWMADDVEITGATSSTLVLTEDLATAEITVSVSYTDNDNFSEVIKSSETDPVVGLTTPATFSGDRSAVIANNTSDDVMGAVVVTDNDEGEAVLEALTDELGMYGTFSILTTGEWTYSLDSSNATVTSLASESDTVTDSFTITSADGTTSTVSITITGVSNVAVVTKVAKITDSMTDDAGELRYKLSDAISAGKLTVSFLKDDKAETSDGTAKDAYIGLYGESTSTSNAIIDLRIQSDKFVIRDQDDIDVSIPFTPGVWTDVEMTWDASSATDSVTPMLTVTINGTSVTTDAFSSASSSPSDVMTGLRYAIFKLGDNGSTIPSAGFYIDDVKIYSDLAGTTIAFEDDFEGYSVGDSLDDDNADSPYNSNSAEVSVIEVTKGGTSEEPVDNQMAKITDSMTDDAGELRYKLSDAIVEGKMTVSFWKDDMAETADGTAKDAYIGLYGESTSTSNAIVDLRIQADKFVLRDQDDIDVTVPFVPNQWNQVEMTWDASDATDTVTPLLTITINGTSVTTDAFSSASSSPSDVMTGVRYAIFKLGDNGSTLPTAAYYIDNIKIYSDLAGTTVAFEDDFESYAEGVSLDTDNADSPYNSNSAEVVVVKE